MKLCEILETFNNNCFIGFIDLIMAGNFNLQKTIETLMLLFKGFFMGIADIIPGVSGGTIALITNVYEQLIMTINQAVDNIIQLKNKKYNIFYGMNMWFIVPLLIGIVSAFIMFSGLINLLINNYPGFVYSFFIGLISASAGLIFMRVKRFNLNRLMFALLGLVSGVMIVSVGTINANHSLPIIFLSGMLAICAMILPGVSGSFILLILGQYQFMLNALHDFFANLKYVASFIAGAVIGLLTFSKLIAFLLKRFHDNVIIFLVGLMIGSLKLPVLNVINSSVDVFGDFKLLLLYLALVLFGIVIVVMLHVIESKIKKRKLGIK